MTRQFTPAELEAYLDEELSADDLAAIEESLQGQPELVKQLVAINTRREAGVHSIGGVWRRHRIGCATREQLGSYLLGAIGKEHRDYLAFHLEVVGCRYCQASLADLQSQQEEANEEATSRRARYFQTSAGYLSKDGLTDNADGNE